MEHFEINIFKHIVLFGYDFSITSALLYLLSLSFFLGFFMILSFNLFMKPKNGQVLAEAIYLVILTIFKQQISSVRVMRFFPLLFTIFVYIFILNFTSLFVFGVSVTGHIMVTCFFSFSFFLGVIIIGFLNHGSDFFKLFVPQNVPKVLLDFLVVIEVFSFLIRPFSLSIRLFANMLAGHTLLGIFAQFGAFITKNYYFFIIIPILLLVAVFFLEIAVSLIQAYIFVSLACIYLNDVVILH
ncbi:MAG TPA: F0F1 ATP synthase subunit A [Saprospiraceae bacterium]|nr:F0F1 ATP synthase subunit A [Saprospiraceae bacterium]